jgi:hypothetical protein
MLDLTHYPPAVAELLGQLPLVPLGPGTPVPSVRATLEGLRGLPVTCRSGLWLAFNYLDESHTISQDIHTPEGSFWHAIMHRREPDAWNSKYWWRKVGSHPVFGLLADEAARLGWKAWTPDAFVDACEAERGTGSQRETLLREIQLAEWRTLFAWCWKGT